ncbi:MAG: cysteine desulfurase family protein [bacterium]
MARVNFDHAAAAPLLPEARAAMLLFLDAEYGNPSSLHSLGERPKAALDRAREQVAALVNSNPEEIVFAASGSEANNHAIKGFALSRMDKGRHIVTSAIEHFSVLEPVRSLKKLGFEVTELPVNRDGVVHPDVLAAAIRPDTILVSVMHANYEVGTLQDIAALAAIARERKVPFHSDGCAAIGRIPVDVAALGVGAYSFPAQSTYGPRGAAALYLRRGVRIQPLVEGGTQEKNRRAGTEDVAAIAGFGAAAEVARANVGAWGEQMSRLARRIRVELPTKIERLVFTGSAEQRIPGHLSVCVEFVEGEGMLLFLDDEGISAASGSSCTAKTLKASHVLLAMGLPHSLAQTSLVLTLGRASTDADVDLFLDRLPPVIKRLRAMSPLHAKFLKGEDPYAARPGESCEDDHHHEPEES